MRSVKWEWLMHLRWTQIFLKSVMLLFLFRMWSIKFFLKFEFYSIKISNFLSLESFLMRSFFDFPKGAHLRFVQTICQVHHSWLSSLAFRKFSLENRLTIEKQVDEQQQPTF